MSRGTKRTGHGATKAFREQTLERIRAVWASSTADTWPVASALDTSVTLPRASNLRAAGMEAVMVSWYFMDDDVIGSLQPSVSPQVESAASFLDVPLPPCAGVCASPERPPSRSLEPSPPISMIPLTRSSPVTIAPNLISALRNKQTSTPIRQALHAPCVRVGLGSSARLGVREMESFFPRSAKDGPTRSHSFVRRDDCCRVWCAGMAPRLIGSDIEANGANGPEHRFSKALEGTEGAPPALAFGCDVTHKRKREPLSVVNPSPAHGSPRLSFSE